MSLKQRLRMADILTNNTKMGWNCDSDREKCKYNGKIPTATCPWNSDLRRQIWWPTTQRWVETATATQKSTNTIVKYQQRHVLETATWDGRYGDKHRDGLKLRQRQRTAQIQRWNTNRDLSSSSILEMTGCEIQTRDVCNPLKRTSLQVWHRIWTWEYREQIWLVVRANLFQVQHKSLFITFWSLRKLSQHLAYSNKI